MSDSTVTPLELLSNLKWARMDAKLNTGVPPRIPPPQHRHSTPSGPWPWQDLESTDELDDTVRCKNTAIPAGWAGYPQSLFGNWLPPQVYRSGITKAIQKRCIAPCTIYFCDILDDGRFDAFGKESVENNKPSQDNFWDYLQLERPPSVRVRVLCVENMSGPVLQMLGTKYNIEPFFFSSSLNWIPSRFFESLVPEKGDHVTITLTFLRTMPNPADVHEKYSLGGKHSEIDQIIDTQAPLYLRSTNDPKDDQILLLDLLAVHMVRKSSAEGSSTIITYHPEQAWGRTTAKGMHSRVRLAGESVYWSKIFDRTSDPTLALLTILWHALYLWDQALSTLYDHICWLESMVISTNDMTLTQSLHIIRAHLLHYASLLEDFKKSVQFVLDTPNPGMDSEDEALRKRSRTLLEKECQNLLLEIERLEKSRAMQNKRLKNVMNLVFSAAAVRDSAAMKQISYLTMIFLPASFVSGIFGMNIREINPGTYGSILHYFVTALPLTLLTVWIIVAFQSKRSLGRDSASLWSQFGWPVHMVMQCFSRRQDPTPGDRASDGIHDHYTAP